MTNRIRIILTVLLVAAITALAILLVKAPEPSAPRPTAAQTEGTESVS